MWDMRGLTGGGRLTMCVCVCGGGGGVRGFTVSNKACGVLWEGVDSKMVVMCVCGGGGVRGLTQQEAGWWRPV